MALLHRLQACHLEADNARMDRAALAAHATNAGAVSSERLAAAAAQLDRLQGDVADLRQRAAEVRACALGVRSVLVLSVLQPRDEVLRSLHWQLPLIFMHL